MTRVRKITLAVGLGMTVLLLCGIPLSHFVTQTDAHSTFRPGKDGKTEIGTRATHTQDSAWGLLGYYTVRRQMCEDIFADGNHVVRPWTTSTHFDLAAGVVTGLLLILVWLCAVAAMREEGRGFKGLSASR